VVVVSGCEDIDDTTVVTKTNTTVKFLTFETKTKRLPQHENHCCCSLDITTTLSLKFNISRPSQCLRDKVIVIGLTA